MHFSTFELYKSMIYSLSNCKMKWRFCSVLCHLFMRYVAGTRIINSYFTFLAWNLHWIGPKYIWHSMRHIKTYLLLNKYLYQILIVFIFVISKIQHAKTNAQVALRTAQVAFNRLGGVQPPQGATKNTKTLMNCQHHHSVLYHNEPHSCTDCVNNGWWELNDDTGAAANEWSWCVLGNFITW